MTPNTISAPSPTAVTTQVPALVAAPVSVSDAEEPRALPWRRTLAAKYALWLGALVAGALLASSALQTEFSFRERQAELVLLQREKANVVAGRVERFLTEIAMNMDWVVTPGPST